MKMVCSTIISEGGFVPRGASPPRCPATPHPSHRSPWSPCAQPDSAPEQQFSFLIEDNKPVEFRVILYFNQAALPALAWADVNGSYSVAQYSDGKDVSGNVVPLPVSSNSVILYNNVVLGESSSSINFSSDQGLEGIPFLGSSYTGTPDFVYIAARALKTTSPVVHVTMNWDEIQ
jgi:hypothetical protein